MLDKYDLLHISTLVAKLLEPIYLELKEHRKILDEHTTLLKEHSKKHKQHSRMFRMIKRDQNTMLGMLDREQMDQRKRLSRIEERLDI